MSVNSIKKIIEARNYEEALEEVNSSIEKIKNELHNEEKYLRYKELINLRIYLNFQLSKEDDIIETIARKERYPFISFIDFGHNNYVKLLDKDIFHIKTGAYINAIHQNRIFEKTGKSFSKALENKVGKEEIEKQLLSEINNGDLPYYTITHKLSAPKSFHIPSITDQNTIDHQKLRNGLKHVLNNFITTKEKSFTFVAIGATAKLKNQDEQDEIIEIIADELNDFKMK
ncbi:MAG: hypothetical protein KDC88_17450 [Ignavibacteriae bacterium]|nr:hypothetical protein [Ignavibacteriota bacterium]